jgi:hypothetical protein
LKLLTTLGAVMMVLGFIASAVGAFPLADVSASVEIDEDTPFSTEAVEQTAGQVGAMYTTVIDDVMSFADNPDLALATQRRDQMTVYANDLAGRFQLFADDLQVELDGLAEAPAAPTGLTATAENGNVVLVWDASTDADFNFTNVYRATSLTGPFTLQAGGLTTQSFVDASVVAGTTYTYDVTAVNDSMVESLASNPATERP